MVLFDTPGAGAEKRVIAPPGAKPVGPYSPGILAGDFLYVSGQGGRDAEGTLPATIEGQVRQTLQNVKAIVEAAGLTMEHVVYSQVYLNDMAHYDAMDRVWREFFPKAPPARAVLGVYRLPTDIAVEINAVAFRDLVAQEAHRPGRIPAEPVVVTGHDGRQPAVPVRVHGRRRGDGQDAAGSGRPGATGARQHETDAGRGRHGLPPRRVRQPVPDGQGLAAR